MTMGVEPPDEDKIHTRKPRDEVFERRLRPVADLVHERPARVGHEHDLSRARLPVDERVLARSIEVEAMVRMLDRGHSHAAPSQSRQQQGDRRRLSRPAAPDKSDHPYGQARIRDARETAALLPERAPGTASACRSLSRYDSGFRHRKDVDRDIRKSVCLKLSDSRIATFPASLARRLVATLISCVISWCAVAFRRGSSISPLPFPFVSEFFDIEGLCNDFCGKPQVTGHRVCGYCALSRDGRSLLRCPRAVHI